MVQQIGSDLMKLLFAALMSPLLALVRHVALSA